MATRRFPRQTATNQAHNLASDMAAIRVLVELVAQSAAHVFGVDSLQLVEVRADLRQRNSWLCRATVAGGASYGGRLLADQGIELEWCHGAGCTCFSFDSQPTPVFSLRIVP